MISGGDENQDSVSRRNILAARKVLWRLGLLLQNQDVGGDKPLELFLDVTDGTVTVQSGSVKRNV
jgi:chemotaxis receptor (MCP) glutamine deamidase CheD